MKGLLSKAGLFITLVALLLGSAAFFPSPTYAATGTIIDKHIIKIGNDLYYDSDPFDGNNEYVHDEGDGCESKFEVDTDDFTATLKKQTVRNNDCVDESEEALTFPSTGNFYIQGYRIDETTIFLPVWRSPGGFGGASSGPQRNGTYIASKEGDTEYLRDGINYDDGGTRVRYPREGEAANVANFQSQRCNAVGCDNINDDDFILANNGDFAIPDATVYPDAPKANAPGNPDDGDEDGLQADCPIEGTGAFGWVLCPVYELAEEAINGLTDFIEDLLRFNIDEQIGGEDSAVKQVWQSFRNIANIMFIIAFLALILSQTLGGRL